MAGEGPEDPDAGDVDDAEDGEEVSLDGVQIGPPGAEATALLGWLSSAASAGAKRVPPCPNIRRPTERLLRYEPSPHEPKSQDHTDATPRVPPSLVFAPTSSQTPFTVSSFVLFAR